MEIKFLILVLLVLSFLLFWFIPKLPGSKKLKMNQTLFYLINLIGILVGGAGLLLTAFLKSKIMSEHYFEILLFPVFLSYLFLGLVFRIQGEDAVLDEKQNWNMTQAAGITFPLTIIFSFFLYAFDKSGQLISGPIFFASFMFFSICCFSGATLYFYKKN